MSSIKNFQEEFGTWIKFGSFLLIWFGLQFITKTGFVFTKEALLKVPDAIAIYLVLKFIFTRWAWRWLPVGVKKTLIPFPDVQGTWKGKLDSDLKGKMGSPIDVYFAIKQNFSSVSIVVFTKESMSRSVVSNFRIDEDSSVTELFYVFTNRPKAGVRNRSEPHFGAVILRVIDSPKRNLVGEYWTDRATRGDIKLSFVSGKLVQKFPSSEGQEKTEKE